MAKYVPDITTNRWVIVAEGRTKRPQDTTRDKNAPLNKICVFCPGNEKIPGEELYRLGEGAAYDVGWQVRVIKNKFPITDFHEVIIHSPEHGRDIETLPLSHVELIMRAYRDRYNVNKVYGQVMIFNNVGEVAGASISHPHSQLVVVPKQINLDSLRIEPIVNQFLENEAFVSFCPEFSQWPFETWIAPKKRNQLFGDIDDLLLPKLADILQRTLRRLMYHLADEHHYHPGLPMIYFKEGIAYNYYIYQGKDWYLRIIPRLIHRAGFELGTGLNVNIIDPADAATILKEDGQGEIDYFTKG